MATDYDPDYDLETWIAVVAPGHHTDATRTRHGRYADAARTLRGRYADATRSAGTFHVLARKCDFGDLKNTYLL